MAGDKIGRKVTVSVAGVVVAQCRSKSLTINNTEINTTTEGDNGIQQLLPESGEQSVQISLDGLYLSTETSLLDAALVAPDSQTLETVEFDYGAYTISGQFKQTSYSEGLPYNEAVTFSASFNSSGAVVKTVV